MKIHQAVSEENTIWVTTFYLYIAMYAIETPNIKSDQDIKKSMYNHIMELIYKTFHEISSRGLEGVGDTRVRTNDRSKVTLSQYNNRLKAGYIKGHFTISGMKMKVRNAPDYSLCSFF